MAYLSRYKDLVATGNITSNVITSVSGTFDHTDTLLANVSQLASSNIHGTYVQTIWPSTGFVTSILGQIPGPNQFNVDRGYPSPNTQPPFYTGQKIGFGNHVILTVVNQTQFAGLWTVTVDKNAGSPGGGAPILYPLDQYANASFHTSGNSFVQLIDGTVSDRLVIQSGSVTGSVDNMVVGGITAANGYFTEDHANNIYLNHGIYFGEDGSYQNTAFRWANNYTSTLTPNNAIGREHDNWLYTDPTPFQQYVKINNQWALNQNTSALISSMKNDISLGLNDLFDVAVYDTLVDTSANGAIALALDPASGVTFGVTVDRREWTVDMTFSGLDTANVANLIALGTGTVISSNVTTNYQGLGTVPYQVEIVSLEEVNANTVTLHTRVPAEYPQYVNYLADAVSANLDTFTSTGSIASNYFQTGKIVASANNSGRVMVRSADNSSWVAGPTVASITNAGGVNGSVQYNDNGAFAGESAFTYDAVADALYVGGSSVYNGTFKAETGTTVVTSNPNFDVIVRPAQASGGGELYLDGNFDSTVANTGGRANLGTFAYTNLVNIGHGVIGNYPVSSVAINGNAAFSQNVALGNISNLNITGGTTNQVLTVLDGANGIVGFVDTASTVSGSNTQVQYNLNGTLYASDALRIVDDGTNNTLLVGNNGNGIVNSHAVQTQSIIGSDLVIGSVATNTSLIGPVSFPGANVVTFGDVSTVSIQGGLNGQVIATDGTGNLSWTDAGSGSSNVTAIPSVEFAVSSNGAGQVFNSDVFGLYANTADLSVFRNGVLMQFSSYSLSGNNLTINTNLYTGDTLDVPSSKLSVGGISRPSGTVGTVQFASGIGTFSSNANFRYDTANGQVVMPGITASSSNVVVSTSMNMTGNVNVTGTLQRAEDGQELTANWVGLVVNAGENTKIVFSTPSSNIPGLTYANGVFTNTGTKRKFIFDYTMTFLSGSKIQESAIWLQKNAPNNMSTTSRYGQQVQLNCNGTSSMSSTSHTFVMNTGDTVSCWAWCDQNAFFGSPVFGMTANTAFVRITQI